MTEPGVPSDEGPCVHRWLLATPGRDVTAGLCAYCGAERGFTGANKQRPPTVWRRGKPAAGSLTVNDEGDS